MREKPKLPYIPQPKPYPTGGMTLGVRLGSQVLGGGALLIALYSAWVHVIAAAGPTPHPVMQLTWTFYLAFLVYTGFLAGAFAGALVGAAVDRLRGEWE